MIGIFTTVLVLTFVVHVAGICNCASFVSEGGGDDWDGYTYRRLSGCNDLEQKTECERAEWEMVDFVNGVMNFVRALVTAHPSPDVTDSQGVVTKSGLEIDGDNMGVLSRLLEENRPVPDCSTGLFTTTPMKFLADRSQREPLWKEDYDDDDDITEDFCISREILEQCESAKAKIETYIDNVIDGLHNSERASRPFVKVVENRLHNSILPTISCQTTKHNIRKASAASQSFSHHSPLAFSLALYIFLIH